MGFVIVLLFPLILFILIVALLCYLIGRNLGRREAARMPQFYRPPASPHQSQSLPHQDKPSQPVKSLGVAKVVDSEHPEFKKGALVWGLTTWEEYTLITAPEGFFKI